MAVRFRAANSGLSRNNPLHWQMSRMWHDTIPGCSVSLPCLSLPNEGPGRSGLGRIHQPLLNIFPIGWCCSPATEWKSSLISFLIYSLAFRTALRMQITNIIGACWVIVWFNLSHNCLLLYNQWRQGIMNQKFRKSENRVSNNTINVKKKRYQNLGIHTYIYIIY